MSAASGAARGVSAGIGDSLKRLAVTELKHLAGAVGDRATAALRERLGDVTQRLTDYAERGGSPAMVAAAKGASEMAGGASPVKALTKGGLRGGLAGIKRLFGGGRGKTRKLKLTNIVEWADVGVPLRVAYNQWTSFEEFPKFMKKLEKVDREGDEKLNWRAQIFWSHRDWQSTIIHMQPDERIVWQSKGPKGHVDGAVSFHELSPTLTRIVLVLEYYPKGFFEHTGNLWRAQGRRARLEFKHFVRHTMTQTILHPEEVEGWRGTIRDGQVVEDHDAAVRREKQQGGEGRHGREEHDGEERREQPRGEQQRGREERRGREPEGRERHRRDRDEDVYAERRGAKEAQAREHRDRDRERGRGRDHEERRPEGGNGPPRRRARG